MLSEILACNVLYAIVCLLKEPGDENLFLNGNNYGQANSPSNHAPGTGNKRFRKR